MKNALLSLSGFAFIVLAVAATPAVADNAISSMTVAQAKAWIAQYDPSLQGRKSNLAGTGGLTYGDGLCIMAVENDLADDIAVACAGVNY